MRTGFSLSEILVATAVLGIGLVMVIAVFPAAVEINKDSTNDVMGTMICENSLNMVKVTLRRAEVTDTLSFGVGGYPSLTDTNMSYPTGDSNLARGSIVLARRVSANPNDFQFVIAAFTKNNPLHYVRAHVLTGASFDANYMAFSAIDVKNAAGNPTWLKIGSPVIDPARGDYANIVGFTNIGGNNWTVYLNHPLDRSRPGIIINNPIVIAETTDPSGLTPDNALTASPVTCVMIARSGLSTP
jgi:prepilin-type N-terminal cleavage/methylation domain-containing protein